MLLFFFLFVKWCRVTIFLSLTCDVPRNCPLPPPPPLPPSLSPFWTVNKHLPPSTKMKNKRKHSRVIAAVFNWLSIIELIWCFQFLTTLCSAFLCSVALRVLLPQLAHSKQKLNNYSWLTIHYRPDFDSLIRRESTNRKKKKKKKKTGQSRPTSGTRNIRMTVPIIGKD